MHSLLIRIFLSFWLIIGITIGAAALGGYWYAERVRDQFENFDIEDMMLEASGALESGGRDGLETWLRRYAANSAVTVLVLDDSGHDLIDRRVPDSVRRTLGRHRRHISSNRRDHLDPGNLRRARPLSQLIAPDGELYTFVVSRYPGPPVYWSRESARLFILMMAIVISAAVSFLLARALTRPVTKLRDATVSLAEGKLDIRVADAIGRRNDEFGLLARDFDSMASKLQESARQQTELSRNISHELRSPLARLRVALELARRQTGDLHEFDRIDNEAERLDSLIGQILSYTRMDSSSLQESATFDLAELVHEIVENVNFECRSEGIEGVHVHAKIMSSPSIDGHRSALSSAIENVLRNAVRHSPPNCEIALTLSNRAEHAVIEILDQGQGVDDSELPHLFEAFYRTRKSAENADNRGTGLGLAIAKRAVRMNNGTIAAINSDDGGLLVTIHLPMQKN